MTRPEGAALRASACSAPAASPWLLEAKLAAIQIAPAYLPEAKTEVPFVG